MGTLPDGKKSVISNATRYVYGLEELVSLVELDTLVPLDTWYLGGITDETPREFSVKLDFLTPGKTYDAIIYADAKDASGIPDASYNPYGYTITTKKVTSKTILKLKMAPCGGFAVSIREKQ